MLRTLRALTIAAVILVSLLGSASAANAGSTPRPPVKNPPARALDITWE